jgi:hypothetical protein
MTASEQGVTTVKVKTAAVNVTWLASLVFSTLALWPSTALGQTGWSSADIGDVGTAGGAAETNGVWTVQGAGGDVWGTADAFHFVYRPARTDDMQILARVDDLQNTDPFAKAGVMLRSSLDPSAATVILDAKPNGEVEFMARLADGGQMSYLGGAFVTLPAWVRLSWQQPSSDSIVSALAWVSEDGVSWSQIGGGVGEVDFRYAGSNIYAGVAVTSHDTSQLNTAHVQSLSVRVGAHQHGCRRDRSAGQRVGGPRRRVDDPRRRRRHLGAGRCVPVRPLTFGDGLRRRRVPRHQPGRHESLRQSRPDVSRRHLTRRDVGDSRREAER